MRTPLFITCLLVCYLFIVTANDDHVISTHPELAHADANSVFIPHMNLPEPGTVVHHPDVRPPVHIDENGKHHAEPPAHEEEDQYDEGRLVEHIHHPDHPEAEHHESDEHHEPLGPEHHEEQHPAIDQHQGPVHEEQHGRINPEISAALAAANMALDLRHVAEDAEKRAEHADQQALEYQLKHLDQHPPQHVEPAHELPFHDGIQIVKSPEHGTALLHCPAAEGFIHIIDTSYGQGQGDVNMGTGVIAKGPCHTPLDIESTGCQGAASCYMLTDNEHTHGIDPCVDVFKRAVITYKCTHDPIPSIVHPIDPAHSPPFELHPFVAPPIFRETGHATPSFNDFFHHFYQNQLKSRFPFPEGEECEADAHRLCGGLLKNCVGMFDCTTQCITDHAPHLSPKCLERHPCFPDIDTYCKDVPGGSNGIMHCLKINSDKLSHQCTQLHPCLLDTHCQLIDYDNHEVQVHQPIMRNIPQFMNFLHSMRHLPENAPERNPPKDELPFIDLVLPSLLRTPEHFEDEHHVAGAGEAGADEPQAAEEQPEDPTDEDFPNELDSKFDIATLGTGHFSHITLKDYPGYVVDVYTKGPQPADGYEVAVWALKTHDFANQLFDYNHLGHIFWIHPGADHSHFCLTSHPTHVHQVVSEQCIHEIGGPLSDEAKAQVFHLEGIQIKHAASGKCLEVAGLETAQAHNGLSLHLSDCITHSPAQSWSWETAQMIEANAQIFDEHHQKVLEHLKAGGGTHVAGQRNYPPLPEVEHLQTEVHHEEAQIHQLADQVQQHAAEHNKLIEREHADYEHEESQIQHLENEVENLRLAELANAHGGPPPNHPPLNHHEEAMERSRIQRLQHEIDQLQGEERASHAEMERERSELNTEREQVHHQEQEIHDEQAQLAALEEQVRQIHEKEGHHNGGEEEEIQHQHNGRVAPFTPTHLDLPAEDGEHFFTPMTLLFSMAFVALLAYVFRVYLWPRFVKRYTHQAPSHYYSHAY